MTCTHCKSNLKTETIFGKYMILCGIDNEYHVSTETCDNDSSVCKYCGAKNLVKHIVKEGARFHVTHWDTRGSHCSEGNCMENHGYGKCVPLKPEDVVYRPPMRKIL